MSIRITKCVCVNRTFADLRDQAEADGLDVDQLMLASGAGKGCGLCRPYLKRALQTGQTEFTQILADSARA